ncbi:TlpA disulfide reductase family protein [Candidatus Poribacteria bacterium]
MRIQINTTGVYLLLLAASITPVSSCSEDQILIDESEILEPIDNPEVQEPSEPQIFSLAPAFQGIDLVDGKNISSDDTEGYVRIINFWATWCPPCQAEIPGLIGLQNKYADRKFTVIGISLDTGGAAVVESFIEENGINYPVILATKQTVSDYEDAIDTPIHSIPTSMVVDRDGGIISVHVGFRTKEQFEEEIQKLL